MCKRILKPFRDNLEGLFIWLKDRYICWLKNEFDGWLKFHLTAFSPRFLATTRQRSTWAVAGIIVIQSKLDNLDKQDFYFQKGRKSNEKRLDEMKVEYSRIVEFVNGNDVDFFFRTD